MLLILWLLSQCRTTAPYWKHSGIIKLPGDSEMLTVQQATTQDYPSSTVTSTKLSKALVWSQFILGKLARIIKLPWFLEEKHKGMSCLCINKSDIFVWMKKKKMLTNSLMFIYAGDTQVLAVAPRCLWFFLLFLYYS